MMKKQRLWFVKHIQIYLLALMVTDLPLSNNIQLTVCLFMCDEFRVCVCVSHPSPSILWLMMSVVMWPLSMSWISMFLLCSTGFRCQTQSKHVHLFILSHVLCLKHWTDTAHQVLNICQNTERQNLLSSFESQNTNKVFGLAHYIWPNTEHFLNVILL